MSDNILSLPGNIQASFQHAAMEMLSSLIESKLHVVLIPAPYHRYPGHMIRLAVEHNTEWFKALYSSRERKVDRERTKQALGRIISLKYKKFGRHEYNILIFDAVRDYLENNIQCPDTIRYFKTGVPF